MPLLCFCFCLSFAFTFALAFAFAFGFRNLEIMLQSCIQEINAAFSA